MRSEFIPYCSRREPSSGGDARFLPLLYSSFPRLAMPLRSYSMRLIAGGFQRPSSDLRLRSIEPHRQPKRPLSGAGSQFDFLVGAGVLVLDVKVERAVGIELQRVAVADGEAVDRVGDLEALRVVHA